MDPSDEFDDIFLDSTVGGDNPQIVETSANSETGLVGNIDSSSSDDSSDSSDDSSVESETNGVQYTVSRDGGLFNSSKAEDRNSRYFSKLEENEIVDVLQDEKEGKDAGTHDDDLDDVDDEALNEFFCQNSPKSQTPSAEAQKKSTNRDTLFELDEESSDEEVVLVRKKKASEPVDLFGELDDDELAELEMDEVIEDKLATSGTSHAAATQKKLEHHSQDSEPLLTPRKMEDGDFDSEDKTPYRITYNGEKKKCHEEDLLFASSDDEEYAVRRSTKSKKSKLSPDAVVNAPAGPGLAASETHVRIKESSNDGKENNTTKISPRVNPYQKTKTPDQAKKLSSSNPNVNSDSVPAALSSQTSKSAHKQTELQRLDIGHDFFKPPKYIQRPNPILHKLNDSNRPVHNRRKKAVGKIFSRPFSNMFTCKYQEFNHLQSEMSNVIANSDDNVIVSSPTGSGKTALFEMAMCRLFATNPAGGTRVVSNSKKIVYIAPNKALCEERHADWSKRLAQIDPSIVCATITGDVGTASSFYDDIASANLVLTTPEKWDSITRRWTEFVVLLGSVKLVLLDEIHMIGEPDRGACWESVISRMKTIQRAATSRKLSLLDIKTSSFTDTSPEALASNLRIIAVSATLPNLDHLASFIEAGEAYAFNDSYRPVPLHTYVQACGHIGQGQWKFDNRLTELVPDILKRFSKGRPAIIFCHSRKATRDLADNLTKTYSSSLLNTSVLNNFANRASCSALQRFIRCGIAYHNSELDFNDRKVVEEAFLSGSISALCATSTLAMGVNLPSHLVIVKGTSAYRGKDQGNGGYVDIDTGTLLQMIGRAGRPGFDTSGTAVIMTDSASKSRYENLSLGVKVVESHLLDNDKLTEALNCEIAQGVITSEHEAADWTMGTFLFRRIQAHPLFYGLNGSGINAACSFVTERSKKCIEQLYKVGAIVVNEDGTFSHSAASSIMSRNFLDLQSLRSITRLHHDAGQLQIIHFLANCSKLQTHIKKKEKKELNAAYKNVIKYKFEGPQSKVRIQSPDQKVFVLLQSAISNHRFVDSDLCKQMESLVDETLRILAALEEYSKEGSCNGHLIVQSQLLRRSIFHGMWGEKDGLLKQIGGVTHDVESKLRANGISSFTDVANSFDGEEIARMCNMPPAFGHNLRAAASVILQSTLTLSACTKECDDGLNLIIKLRRKEFDSVTRFDNTKDNVKYSLLAFTDRSGGLLLSREDVSEECDMTVKCPQKFGRIYIRLISNLIGLDEHTSVDGDDQIEKSSFSLSPPTAKSTAMSKKSQQAKQPATAKKRLFESHRSSVSNVSDLRLHKRGKPDRSEKIECIEIDSDNEDNVNYSNVLSSNKVPSQKAVTPSPHPSTKTSSTTPTFSEISTHAGNNHTPSSRNSNPSASRKLSAKSRDLQNRFKWNHDKRSHKTSQQNAFLSPRDNPFTTYSYDPNATENSLSTVALRSVKPIEKSILPSRSTVSMKRAPRCSTFRTPATVRRKSGASLSRVSGAAVLKHKADELNNYQTQRQAFSKQNRYSSVGHFAEREPMPSGASYFEPQQQKVVPMRFAKNGSRIMDSRPQFRRMFSHEIPVNPPQRSPRDNYFGPFASVGGPTPAMVNSSAHGTQRYETRPFVQDSPSVMYDGASYGDYSNGSGLPCFSRQSHFGSSRNSHRYDAPNMHFQTYYMPPNGNIAMTSDQDHFDSYDYPFDGLDPTERSMLDTGHFVFNGTSGNEGGSFAPSKPRNYAPVRNPYARSPQKTFPSQQQPPKEIVYQSQELSNAQHHALESIHQNNLRDDASLAFDDAFL